MTTFRLCVNETLIGRENYLYNYYEHQEGLEELRQSVQKLLFEQAIYSKPDQLVLTSGTQQALFYSFSNRSPKVSHRKFWLSNQPTIE